MADYGQTRMISGDQMPYWLRDIYAYQEGGPAPRRSSEYFTKQGDMDRYDEFLARLLSKDKYEELVAGWLSTDETKVDPKQALLLDPRYGSMWSRAQNPVPTYVK